MSQRILSITSPWTGEVVAVVPDAEYAAAMGRPLEARSTANAGSVLTLQSARKLVLRTLWEHGPFEDRTGGRATALLHAAMVERGNRSKSTALSGVLLDAGPAIDRTTNGKRTYRIAFGLVPEHWAAYLLALPAPAVVEPPAVTPEQADRAEAFAAEERAGLAAEPATEPVEALEPEPATVAPEPEEEAPNGLAPTLEVAGIVAMELLTRVIEIVSTGTAPDRASHRLREERDDARTRLAEALAYGETLRGSIRRMERERDVLGSEVTAMRRERDGLRSRLRDTEANLTAALRGDAAAYVNGEVSKAIDRVMRVSEPRTMGGAA